MLVLIRLILLLMLLTVSLHTARCATKAPCVSTTSLGNNCTCEGSRSHSWCYTNDDMSAWRYCTSDDQNHGFNVPKNCYVSCATIPCENGGVCSSSWGVFGYNQYCSCNNRYSGLYCENVSPCTYYGCDNGGTCSSDASGNNVCVCRHGYSGDFCDKSACSSSPCLYGGQCELYDDSEHYYCACNYGYRGKNCEDASEACPNVPCRHGGTCNCYYGYCYCQCDYRYSGTYCEHAPPNACSNWWWSGCNNGGSCVSDVNGYYFCSCPPGTSGYYCENSPCSSSPCRHGGTCQSTPSNGQDYTCHCRDGYNGLNCEDGSAACSAVAMPCQNGGYCFCNGDWCSCHCNNLYYGTMCENAYPCSAGGAYECQSFGNCTSDGNGNDWCVCKEGYTGAFCENIP